MNLNSLGGVFNFSYHRTIESVLSESVDFQKNLFEEIKKEMKPANTSTASLYEEADNEITEGMQLYMMAYKKLHPSAHFFRKSENELTVIDGKKTLTVHFDKNGKVEYIETVNENGDYELSEGKFGKDKNEAISKIMKLYKEHGKTPELVGDIVVVNKENSQLQYKVEGNGVVKNVNYVTDPKDFLGSKKQDNNKTAL